jgi:hypothetical protein
VFIVAILLIVGALALFRLASVREKTASRPGSRPVAEQGTAPMSHDSNRTVASAPLASARTEPTPERPNPPAAARSSSTEPPPPASTPTPERSQPRSAPPTARKAEAPPASNDGQDSQVTLPPPPTRGWNTRDGSDQGSAPAAASSSAAGSEERVAGFLVGELGSARAEERALANAAWYGSDREEYVYWQRVAKLIKQGEAR